MTLLEDSTLALRLDREWRSQIIKRLELFVSCARTTHRLWWKEKNQDPARTAPHAWHARGAAYGYLQAAREMKGLLQ